MPGPGSHNLLLKMGLDFGIPIDKKLTIPACPLPQQVPVTQQAGTENVAGRGSKVFSKMISCISIGTIDMTLCSLEALGSVRALAVATAKERQKAVRCRMKVSTCNDISAALTKGQTAVNSSRFVICSCAQHTRWLILLGPL